MICARCEQPIQGQADTFVPETGSGAVPAVVMCRGGCRAAPRQSYPEEPVILPTSPRSRPARRPRR